MKKSAALTGVDISVESGISTFRGSGVLREQYDGMETGGIGMVDKLKFV